MGRDNFPTLRRLINNVNRFNSAFRGQSYENVVTALNRYYSQRAGFTFNPATPITTAALHNEIRANSRITSGLFEADMMLTMAQLNQIISNRRRRKLGIAAHEIGHSLGLYHEQSRPERDAYIRVNFQNIASGYAGSFDKRSPALSQSLGIPYDYGSVMHYAINSFSKSFGSDTITPMRSQFSYTIGNRVEPAFYDYKAVNLMYCSRSCGSALPCQNEGYTNPNTS
ncbi:unnamed protein product, partial [Mesorhabditis spiculigera]